MKLYTILFFGAFTVAFSSCKKCETCIPYRYNTTTNVMDTVPDTDHAQTVKVCDKTDIDAYESLTDFSDAGGQNTRFVCK